MKNLVDLEAGWVNCCLLHIIIARRGFIGIIEIPYVNKQQYCSIENTMFIV
jgi:hypothetical protein